MTLANTGFSSLLGFVTLCLDRRHAARVRGGTSVAVVDVFAARIFQGQTLDESMTGCRVELGRADGLRVGTRVECHVKPGPGIPLTLRKGKIAWVRKGRGMDGKPNTQAGIAFLGRTLGRAAA